MKYNFAVVIPLANEENDFQPFISSLSATLDKLECGKVYLVVDTVSKDNTLKLCRTLSAKDSRFITIWAPENRNVVDAYIRGYREAFNNKHEFIIEMDGGLSHDPKELPKYLRALSKGNDCAFGSRFIKGGSCDSSFKRVFLSRAGTVLSNFLLGTRMYDMTSGYQGFHISTVEKFLTYKLLPKAHFYQTELRYLLRETRYVEIPIHYQAPSPRVSRNAIYNSFAVLFHYFILRLKSKPASIR